MQHSYPECIKTLKLSNKKQTVQLEHILNTLRDISSKKIYIKRW